MYIYRALTPAIEEAHKYYPVILITGARQVGKSTLCRNLFPDYRFENLENISSRVAALRDPVAFIENLGSRAIIDEVQNCPELFSQIQCVVDEDKTKRFILTGSCNFTLMKNVCQSMVGRVAVFTLPQFSLGELSAGETQLPTDTLIQQGFYPGVIADGIPAKLFYASYYNTYIERDVRDVLRIGNLVKFDTFIRLVASRVGSELNASALSTEVGISSTTISEWISILQASYIVFALPPYFANISKRLTKMPKYYFYDTGLLCYLLNIDNPQKLVGYPLRGQIFENLVVGEMMKEAFNRAATPNLYFYREHSGREVDVLRMGADRIDAYEIKSASTFREEFMSNMDQLKKILDRPVDTTLIYDGQSFPPQILNFRDISSTRK